VRIDQKIKTRLEGNNKMLQEKNKYDFRAWLEDYDNGELARQYSIKGIDEIFHYLERLQDQGDEIIKDLSPTDIRIIFNEYGSEEEALFDGFGMSKEEFEGDLEGFTVREALEHIMERDDQASRNGRCSEIIDFYTDQPKFIIANWINH
jgi:hypothetical protein